MRDVFEVRRSRTRKKFYDGFEFLFSESISETFCGFAKPKISMTRKIPNIIPPRISWIFDIISNNESFVFGETLISSKMEAIKAQIAKEKYTADTFFFSLFFLDFIPIQKKYKPAATIKNISKWIFTVINSPP